MADHVYDLDGRVYAPTEWAGSPWSSQHQHGGPVNALFAKAAEEAADRAGLRVVRLTVDLFRPVPREPLELLWRFVRRGRRMRVDHGHAPGVDVDDPLAEQGTPRESEGEVGHGGAALEGRHRLARQLSATRC